MQGQGKSRRWRYGDKRRHESQCAVSCALAWFRMRCGSDGAGIAGSFASAVTERARLKVSRNAVVAPVNTANRLLRG